MSGFRVTVEIGSPDGSKFEMLEALVGTGASHTVLPGSILRHLGVTPHRTSAFELKDGSRLELQMGQTWLRLNGQLEVTPVAFGSDDMDAVLGAVTLGALLLTVDPIHQLLTPVNALLKAREWR
jgi:predicted aspartyl protease